jgi:hypothetical protein
VRPAESSETDGKDAISRFMNETGPKNFDRKKFKALSDEEKREIRKSMNEAHERFMDVFQNIPPYLVLVIRNLNLTRAILNGHGSGVDRYRVMAEVAVRGKFAVSANARMSEVVRARWARFLFDLRLFGDGAMMAVGKIVILWATWLGLAPNTLSIQAYML